MSSTVDAQMIYSDELFERLRQDHSAAIRRANELERALRRGEIPEGSSEEHQRNLLRTTRAFASGIFHALGEIDPTHPAFRF